MKEDLSPRSNCVSPSCGPRYFCSSQNLPLVQSDCDPKSFESSPACAKINIQFKVDQISKLANGVHSNDVCDALRYLPELQKYADGKKATVHCFSNAIGSVQVAIVSFFVKTNNSLCVSWNNF